MTSSVGSDPNSVFNSPSSEDVSITSLTEGEEAACDANGPFSELPADQTIQSFVATDFSDKLKQAVSSRSFSSSSVSSGGWTSAYGGASSTAVRSPSQQLGSGSTFIMEGSAMMHDPELAPVDPHVVQDLETHAKRVADQVMAMLTLLKTHSHMVSELTVESTKVHTVSVENTCESVMNSIRTMYSLMAKCEEVSKAMQSVTVLREEINNIKRLLDHCEAALQRSDK